MSYINTWRGQLKQHLAQFAPLAKEVLPHQYEFGVVAAALLWGVREASNNNDQLDALRAAVGSDIHLIHLQQAVAGWDTKKPLEAVQDLLKQEKKVPQLKLALVTVMAHFLDILIETQSLRSLPMQTNIDISGTVQGANLVIGGAQYIAGNLVVQYTRQAVANCPNAPKPPEHFTGRITEFGILADNLIGNNIVAITAIHGLGGIGKTALVQAFCHQDEKPFDMVLWATITATPNIASHLIEWGRYAIDDYQLPTNQPLETVVGNIRANLTERLLKDKCGTHCLVVFDDVWESSCEAVELLTKAIPAEAKILITTRHENVANELKARVIPLAPLEDDEAFNMLQNLRHNKHLTDTHLKRLVSIVKGHPLTLELACAMLNGAEDAEHIEKILGDYDKGLSPNSPFEALVFHVDAPDELAVVFERSYNSLLPMAQTAFRKLGVLAREASWVRKNVGAVWQIDEEMDVLLIHNQLRHFAFIKQDTKTSEEYEITFYQQHPLLRSYAQALLNEHEYNSSFGHYVDHITQIAEEFRILPPEEWSRLTPYLPHIDFVGDELVRQFTLISQKLHEPGEIEQSLINRCGQFVWNVLQYVLHRPQVIQRGGKVILRGLTWLEAGLKVYQIQANTDREATVLNDVGGIWFWLGDKQKALEFYYQALSLRRKIADKWGEATVLNNIAGAWSDLGEKRKALQLFEQALSLEKLLGHFFGVGVTLTNIGLIWDALGEKEKTFEVYEQALAVFQNLGHKWNEAETLNCIGLAWDAMGNKHKAIEYYNLALTLRHEVGDKRGEATTLSNIGSAWSDLGELHKALEFYEQALPLRDKVGDRTGEAITLHNIGGVWIGLSDPQKALEYYERSLVLHHKVGNKPGAALTCFSIGAVYAIKEDFSKAIQNIETAIELTFPEDPLLPTFRETLEMLKARQRGWHISPQQLDIVVKNSIDVCTNSQSKHAEWRAEMEHSYQNARVEGRLFEANFFLAVLRVLDGQNFELTNDNPYIPALEKILRGIDEYKNSIHMGLQELEEIIQKTIAACTFSQSRRADWRNVVQGAKSEAQKRNHPLEIDFFLALLQIVDGQQASLPLTNPYQPSIARVIKEITEYVASSDGEALLTLISPHELNMIIKQTVEVCTIAKNKLAEWRGALQDARQHAQVSSHEPEFVFFTALLQVLAGQITFLPDANPYNTSLREILDNIANYTDNNKADLVISEEVFHALLKIYKEQGETNLRTKLKSNNLPSNVIDNLVTMIQSASASTGMTPDSVNAVLPIETVDSLCGNTFAVKTKLHEKLDEWDANLQSIRANFAGRGPNWINEVTLVDALIAITRDEPFTLTNENPYSEAVQAVQNKILEYLKETNGDADVHYSRLSSAPMGSFLDELKILLQELEAALRKEPVDKAEDVALTQEYANEIAEEAAKEPLRKRKLQITGENLKKAAENLLDVSPIVAKIVQKLLMIG